MSFYGTNWHLNWPLQAPAKTQESSSNFNWRSEAKLNFGFNRAKKSLVHAKLVRSSLRNSNERARQIIGRVRYVADLKRNTHLTLNWPPFVARTFGTRPLVLLARRQQQNKVPTDEQQIDPQQHTFN